MRSIVTSIIVVLYWATASVHAAPSAASKPTTAPSQGAPASVSKDNRVVASDAVGFRFQVPKIWKAVTEKPETGEFEYQMGPASRSEERTPTFRIIGAKPCHG